MTTAKSAMEEFAPKLWSVAQARPQEVLFGDIWERPVLDSRDRALISVAALMALYRTEPLRAHIRRAIGLGVTKEELSELITQVAFYAGFPTGAHAATVTKEVFSES